MRITSGLVTVLLAASAFVGPAAADDSEGPKVAPVLLRIEGTPLVAKFDAAAYAENPKSLASLREEFGSAALTAGSAAGGVLLSVVARKEKDGHLTSAEWRKKLKNSDEEIQTFETDDIACFDDTTEAGTLQQADYHAYPVAAGWCFDIRATFLGDPEDDAYFTKRRFCAMVSTFRVGSFRRGSFADYPAEVVDQWHAVAAKHPGWKEAAEVAVAAKPDDWVPAFVAWETARAFGAPEAECAAANERAAALFAKADPKDPAARFAWASAEESLGLAQHAAGKFKLAVVHLAKAADVSDGASKEVRGEAHYSLARALTKAGVTKDALAALKTAIDCDARHRAAAAKEPDFVTLRSRSEFKALVAAPK